MKAEPRRIDAFEPWCWRRLLKVPWTARRSNQSILKEISPGISLEGMMLIGEGNGNPLQCSCLENPRDGEAWWAAIYGVAQSRTWLKRLSSSSSSSNDAKAETPVLWPPHAKSWLTGKISDAGRDWGQEEKGMTEDEMAGWHHRLDRRESEWTLGVGDGQGGLACCNSWGRKESDMTKWLIWSD